MNYSLLGTLVGIFTLGLLSPGPDFFLIVKNSMSGSQFRAFATAWGIAGGLTVQLLALSLGLALAPPLVFTIIQLAGAFFLAYIGTRSLFAKASPPENPHVDAVDDTATSPQSTTQHAGRKAQALLTGFSEGFLCNVTNVKVFVFFVSLFSQFIAPDSPWQWRLLVSGTAVIHAIVMWSLITAALLSPPISRQLMRAQHWLPRAFGIILIGFAVWVCWENAVQLFSKPS